MSFQLRDYQNELVQNVRESVLKGHKRILVQSAAGSGKTVTMASIAKSATDKGNKILFVVHRREIVSQAKDTFYKSGVDKNLSYIGMVQTVTNRLEKLDTPDIIFVDEAHHSLAKTYKRIFKHFDESFVFGFTATPIRTNGKGLKEVYDDLIIGRSVEWLVDNKRLAPFEYYSVDLTDKSKLKLTSTRDFTYQSITDALGKSIFGDVVKTYKKIADGEKTIVYTHSVEASKRVSEAFNASGYKAKPVDGKTPKDEREQAMEDFRSGRLNILTNAELYGEGVDVPDCTCVILLRPTMSLALHIQQSMRPMRFKENKTAKIIDHVGNVYRHGLPDTPHDWTLEDREKKKINNKQTNAPSLTACPHCFAMIKSGSNKCGVCGHEIEVESKPLEQVDAELTEVNKDDFKKQFEKSKLIFKYKKKKKKDLKTMEDFYLFAQAKNYKNSWIRYQMPNGKNMSWQQFYIQLNPIKKKYEHIFN